MARILLVEDNEMNRDMLSRRLTHRGYEILIAVDGEQGVAMAAAERPDLILMDMSLPVVDGWEATRRLKGDPATAAIPLIEGARALVTGNIPGGGRTNRQHFGPHVRVADSIPPEVADLLFDPQTSGGLLIAVSAAVVNQAGEALAAAGVTAAVVGRVEPAGDILISVD